MAKNKGGRPTKMSEMTIQKLEQAYSFGCSDPEACLYADIGTSTLYNYQNSNPEFVERKNLLKQKPVLLARESVIKGMQTDHNLALKYLERRARDEFYLKKEQSISITDEDIKQAQDELISEEYKPTD